MTESTNWGNDNAVFFEEIDADFETTVVNDDKPIVWQGNDIVIKKYFEIPIPILQPGSLLSYEFETSPGDISFQLYMCSDEGEDEDEVLIENERLDSHIEPVAGEVKLQRCGYCVFQFDNTYSWMTDKKLSYHIELFNVPLEIVEQDRAYKSRLILQSLAADNQNLFRACSKAESKYIDSERHILKVEKELEELQAQLTHYRNAHIHYRQDYDEHRRLWEVNDSKILGLCVRCLDRSLLATVFRFLVGDSGRHTMALAVRRNQRDHDAVLNLMLVCRYWLKIMLCDVLHVSLAPGEEPTVPVGDDY